MLAGGDVSVRATYSEGRMRLGSDSHTSEAACVCGCVCVGVGVCAHVAGFAITQYQTSSAIKLNSRDNVSAIVICFHQQ